MTMIKPLGSFSTILFWKFCSSSRPEVQWSPYGFFIGSNNLKKYLRDYLGLGIVAGIVIGLDQWIKALIRSQLAFGEIWSPWPWLTPYARLVHWRNSGAAFGMLQGFGDVFTLLAIVVAGAILYYYPQVTRQDWYLRLAMGLQLGGAVGNLIDRLAQGYVTDFISVGSFPVFNIADSSISIGVAILVIGIWLKEKKEKQALLFSPEQAASSSNDTAPGESKSE
jgi:signal peptidase II